MDKIDEKYKSLYQSALAELDEIEESMEGLQQFMLRSSRLFTWLVDPSTPEQQAAVDSARRAIKGGDISQTKPALEQLFDSFRNESPDTAEQANKEASSAQEVELSAQGSAGESAGPEIDPKALISMFLEVLPQLETLADMRGEIQELLERVPPELQPASEKVRTLATAVIAKHTSEHQEVSSFLSRTAANLDHLIEGLGDGQAAWQSTADQDSLDQKMDAEIKGLGESVKRSSSLEEVQNAVETRLHELREHITARRQSEIEKREAANATFDSLRESVATFQDESNKLRSQLEEAKTDARRDFLTQLANRATFEENLTQEHAKWLRHSTPLSLVFFDIDHFKLINDTHGHRAGDLILKAIAKLIENHLRRSDTLARYGGEEFVMLLPQTGRDQAFTVAEKIRNSIAGTKLRYQEQEIPVTISAGVTEYRDRESMSEGLERADHAMYQAKSDGRNQTYTE